MANTELISALQDRIESEISSTPLVRKRNTVEELCFSVPALGTGGGFHLIPPSRDYRPCNLVMGVGHASQAMTHLEAMPLRWEYGRS